MASVGGFGGPRRGGVHQILITVVKATARAASRPVPPWGLRPAPSQRAPVFGLLVRGDQSLLVRRNAVSVKVRGTITMHTVKYYAAVAVYGITSLHFAEVLAAAAADGGLRCHGFLLSVRLCV